MMKTMINVYMTMAMSIKFCVIYQFSASIFKAKLAKRYELPVDSNLANYGSDTNHFQREQGPGMVIKTN